MADLSLFDLTGKKALVTGGAVGIGRGYAVGLAQAGADVAIVDIDEATGEKTAQEIRDMGRDSLFVPCDVTNKEQVQAMVAAVVAQFGRLDIGVNNAGIGILGGDEDFSIENWDKVIGVNLTGCWLCAQAQAQQFLRQDPPETGKTCGKIINTASMSARISNCNAAYNSSKAAVVQMTAMLAAQWGRFNINVNCISPSYLLSPMHCSTPVEARQLFRDLTPMGYVQRPEDLYGPIVFLASQASNYVTGHDLLVDGGHTLNAWLAPLGREVPPLVSPEEETKQMLHDLDAMGMEYDENGINEDLHPEIANAFKGMLGLE